MRPLILLTLTLFIVRPAGADDAAEARQHYQKAQGHFAVGEFADAAAEFEAAYKVKNDPALLFNAAQSRRLAGDNEKALILYKNYLQFHPRARNIDEVNDQIQKLEEAIAAAEKAKTAPPIGTVEPSPPPKDEPAPPAPKAIAEPQPKAEHKTPIYKQWWLWTAVGVVVAAAVVIPVAVVATQPAPWANVGDLGPGANMALVQW